MDFAFYNQSNTFVLTIIFIKGDGTGNLCISKILANMFTTPTLLSLSFDAS